MPVKIRILSAANKHMQRAGFLKLLAAQVARVETSSLSALGGKLVETVTKRVRVSPPFSDSLREYVQIRLSYDKMYADLRAAVLSGKVPVNLELQDLYLSDPSLPSSTGKLAADSERRYPYLGTALDLIKPGTWSAMTRSILLTHLTPKEELAAWENYSPPNNPLIISREQAAVILYCFLDNDALVLLPLFTKLLELSSAGFDERTAGDFLPAILRGATSTLNKGSLAFEDRERLGQLDKAAENIERWRGKPYTGGGAREENIRGRIEPFCDLGLFTKPDRHRFTYKLTPAFKRFMADWNGTDIDYFLENRFFTTLAAMHGLTTVKPAGDTDARDALRDAGEALKSTLGYSPIRDCSLLAGTRLLFDHQRVLELGTSFNTLRDWQKAAPEIVRFTVDRMGELAYVKFLKPASPPAHANA
jgi:hypothetical protein